MGAILLAAAMSCLLPATDGAHVRSDDALVRSLILEGLGRSTTLRSLDAQLRETDVIVYVQPAIILGGLGGFTSHRVVRTGSARYVFVVISAEGSRARLISLIGHELQHALEIAQVPQVGRTQTVADLFARIGYQSISPRGAFETMGAVEAEEAVRTELLQTRTPACPAD